MPKVKSKFMSPEYFEHCAITWIDMSKDAQELWEMPKHICRQLQLCAIQLGYAAKELRAARTELYRRSKKGGRT